MERRQDFYTLSQNSNVSELQRKYGLDGICLPTTVATILSGYNIQQTTEEVINYTQNLTNIFGAGMESLALADFCIYGLHVEGHKLLNISDREKAKEKIKNCLYSGNAVQVGITGSSYTIEEPYSVVNLGADHSIAFLGVKEENGKTLVYVADPTYEDGWVDLDSLLYNNIMYYNLISEGSPVGSRMVTGMYYWEEVGGEYVINEEGKYRCNVLEVTDFKQENGVNTISWSPYEDGENSSRWLSLDEI